MNIYKASIEKITPRFDFKAVIEVDENVYREERVVLRGLDFPGERTKEGRALRAHLAKVIEKVEFFAIQKYGKDALHRQVVDFFYLPGEEDQFLVAQKGLCLNEELLKLGLAKPYDENKRRIDFSKRSVRVNNQKIDLVTNKFKSEVCMYINDCKQYLKAALENRPVDMMTDEFDPTDEEFLIIYGLKELKDLSVRLSGRRPLDWKGN